MSVEPAVGHRHYLPIPGTRRSFGGVEYRLADSPAGYVYKRDSGLLHAADCRHEPEVNVEPRSRSQVMQAWQDAPDPPVDPRWCPNCLLLPVDRTPSTRPHQPHEQLAKVQAAARVVLDHLFGDGRSVVDPSRVIWTQETAHALASAIVDSLDEGAGTFFPKLHGQLADAPRDVILLAAEVIYLRGVPLTNLTPSKKVEHVATVLSWLPDRPPVPKAMVEGARSGGSFNGGQGYNQQIWQQVPWIARFVERWTALSPADRAAALHDPWRFHAIVLDDEDDLPAIRNAFLFMTFPDVFESIVNDDHKRRIRDTFASVIEGATGSSREAIDRDLYEIRKRLDAENPDGERLDWYVEPWASQWRAPKATDSGDRAWAVRAKPAGMELIRRWLSEGFVSLEASHFEPAPAGIHRARVREIVGAGYGHVDYAQRLDLTEDYYAFLTRMHVGDIVVARQDEQAWLGRLTGDPEWSDDEPRLRRAVAWLPDAVAAAALPSPVPGLLGSTSRSVIDLTEGREALDALFPQTDIPAPEPPPWPIDLPSPTAVSLKRATSELAASVHIDEGWLNEFIAVLESRHQVIIYGPPGTGKTYLARAIARYVAADDAVRLVQFHPSYAYEDFFEGYRPRAQGESGLAFELQPGPLRRIASAAASDPAAPYVLIIDEINRANIAKVFGELYFLLEYRDEYVGLQYSPEADFRLPTNLFIIGTMNTADRSIALVDAAIRRRFSFIEMHPDSEPVASLLDKWLAANHRDRRRADLLRALNAQIGAEDRDFQIGPSYLMRDDADTDRGLERIWDYDILPLLEEHYYGRLDRTQVRERFGLAALRSRRAASADEVGDTVGADDPLPGDRGDVDPP